MADPSELERRLAEMSPQQLELRRREIVGGCNGDYEALTVAHLEELAFITSTLRKRNSGPPKANGKAPKVKHTFASLLEEL